ncbi:hypothetical protein ACJIZ3_000890 [Penstemon smallii]|uniref:tRNA-intron lyase n=1 Tax=Penstemon smallii TaxID=265156 RepID=A0ABD3U539_9LAMI
MAPRWKGKTAEAKALPDPMSKITSRLQSSLIESNSEGLLSGSSVLLAVHPEQKKDKQWFQLSLEEAFYLCSVMKCINIIGENKCIKNEEELWHYMSSKNSNFPFLCKSYCHLRTKNWVVRPGSQYGVDFVAYRHHPALVHSEYAVLVLSENDGNGRLSVWSDFHCTLRLCGSVAKILLVLYIDKNGYDDFLTSCLEHYCVEERLVTGWNAERNRENQTMVQKESCNSST